MHAKARYLTSDQDLDTIDYLLFYEINEEPIKKTNPVTHLLKSGHASRSESAKLVSLSKDATKKNNPLLGLSFTYMSILNAV